MSTHFRLLRGGCIVGLLAHIAYKLIRITRASLSYNKYRAQLLYRVSITLSYISHNNMSTGNQNVIGDEQTKMCRKQYTPMTMTMPMTMIMTTLLEETSSFVVLVLTQSV